MNRKTANHLSFLTFFLFFYYVAYSQNRIAQTINTAWQFHKAGDSAWKTVNLPHSWNKKDTHDDEPGYYRGKAYYRKTIYIPSSWKDKAVYLHLEGANQVTTVWLNGQKVGRHIGGYTAFRFLLDPFIQFSQQGANANELLLEVDNSHQEDIPPLSADFTFFGGIYREVSLVALEKTHFDMENNASNGIFVHTPTVNEQEAAVTVNGAFLNQGNYREITLKQEIRDASGKTVSQISQNYELAAEQKMTFEQALPKVSHPNLWSPEQPYLYTVVSTLIDPASGKVLDQLHTPLGFRWFYFDAAKGFFLNGKPYKLIGTSRHQDYKDLANAVPKALQAHDVERLKEMGGNFLRVAHYPQDPVVLETCDRLGILASVEIPIVNRITESEAFYANCLSMQREMIRQNVNHPSVIIWGYMNEVLLSPRFSDDKPRQELYFQHVAKLANQLETLTRQEDSSRYTMIPNHGNFELYNRVGLTKIPKLVGWNLYQGWYGGKFDGFGEFLDMHHRLLPEKPLLITEYGADVDPRIHTSHPIRFDKSIDYALLYHQAYLKAILDRPFVAAAMAWNLADFSSEIREDSDPHVNDKGLLTLDRQPKDTYYLYQAYLLKKPFVHLSTSGNGFITALIDQGKEISTQALRIFSNQKEVTLWQNGKQLATQEVKDHIATFSVPFTEGINELTVYAQNDSTTVQDHSKISYQLIPDQLRDKPFTSLNISMGDQRIIRNEASHETWLPEQAYRPGSWGYIGGIPFAMKNSGRQPYGTDRNILGTDLDPVYATQRVGIQAFRLDVPKGTYRLTLHFAELLSDKETEALPYNLSSPDEQSDQLTGRTFDVRVNGLKILEKLGNDTYLKPLQAYQVSTEITVNDERGIRIEFIPIKGEAILNGVQISKMY